jgi:feruloyl esterase
VDFGYRSEHAFATAAKAITKAFYGAEPTYSYYDGCSDGGRETLMEVQRYPGDFSAALVGAPAFNQTALNVMQEAYLSTIDFRADGSTILPASKLSMLYKAVIAKCADPKLNNHLIQDPATCAFDPESLKCADSKDSSSCLTAEQVDVVRKAYAGVTAPDATHLYTGGQPYGSEAAWEGLFVPKAGQGQSSVQLYGIGLGFHRPRPHHVPRGRRQTHPVARADRPQHPAHRHSRIPAGHDRHHGTGQGRRLLPPVPVPRCQPLRRR